MGVNPHKKSNSFGTEKRAGMVWVVTRTKATLPGTRGVALVDHRGGHVKRIYHRADEQEEELSSRMNS